MESMFWAARAMKGKRVEQRQLHGYLSALSKLTLA
jgi:hypothetical protein